MGCCGCCSSTDVCSSGYNNTAWARWGGGKSWLIVRLLEVDYSVTTLAAGLGKGAPTVAAAVGNTLNRSDRVLEGSDCENDSTEHTAK